MPNSSLDKKIQAGELATITGNGLRVFPIYQTWGGEASYFSQEQGRSDAYNAIEWARSYGFKSGTRIYFAVDFDALDYQVSGNILPHFRGIKEVLDENGRGYQAGIYGPRNVCSRVGAAGLTSASFVSGMSTGFSGNLGYPMPVDWAFDQIATVRAGTGSSAVEVDKDIASGLDQGQNVFDEPVKPSGADVEFDRSQQAAMLKDLQAYLESINVPENGGPGLTAWGQPNSTTFSFETMLAHDVRITNLARNLRIRKALIQCPLFWEIRKYNLDDPLADRLVIDYHDGTVISTKRDSSTGLGQIFAATAIRARNYCIRKGIATGPIMDPAKDSDLWQVWQKLHYDANYNISTIPLVLIEGADQAGVGRPGLDFTEDASRKTLARYNGTGGKAEEYGRQLLGLYRVFEKYNSTARSR
ncbi:glycoside hydrolase domain-containing protein [Crossiella sp. CA198]|uniref:glycoside hydrolase domain-containing protein n=1 Tax=Crossiella sp. CA198 TaxID=3455607 RepID=UPI003F8D0851